MKKLLLVLLLVACLLPLSKCNERDSEPKLKLLQENEANAKRLWERITKETTYTKYNYWPNHKGIKRGQSPHGAYHKIYINSTLYEKLPIANKIAPYGSYIVKENYSPEKDLLAITLMAKIKNYNPEHNDWFWAKYSPKGEILAKGKEKDGLINGCIKCHQGMSNNDYVIVYPLDKE